MLLLWFRVKGWGLQASGYTGFRVWGLGSKGFRVEVWFRDQGQGLGFELLELDGTQLTYNELVVVAAFSKTLQP